MPNWCATDVAFYGDEKQVKSLYDTLVQIQEAPKGGKSDFGNSWLGHIVAHFDLNPEIRHRGSIIMMNEFEDDSFTLTSEDAWGPMIELWDAVVEHYPDVSYVYRAEEPGMEIYVNTDKEGRFFPDRYQLEIYADNIPEDLLEIVKQWPISVNEQQYYENDKDLFRDMSMLFETPITDLEQLKYEIQVFNETYESLGLDFHFHEYVTE